jgi:hypothetical protein
MMGSISWPVPTGTVDLVITKAKRSSARVISRAPSKSKLRSAKPSPRREGVLTAMNIGIGGGDRTGKLGGEFQPAGACGDHVVEPRLIN